MNPNEAAGEGLDGPVAAEQGAEAVGEGQVTRRPQKGAWSLTVAEEHHWDAAKTAEAARILAAHPPRDYTVATTTGPAVQGRCPACRRTSLFLGNGGHVTCARLDCPSPCAADDLLHGQPAVEIHTSH